LWKRRKQIADDGKKNILMCDKTLQESIPAALIKDWNPGVLAHYGRAELKQSDHRPVIAIIDAEVLRVDEERRQQVSF
jgi:synaptojanin